MQSHDVYTNVVLTPMQGHDVIHRASYSFDHFIWNLSVIRNDHECSLLELHRKARSWTFFFSTENIILSRTVWWRYALVIMCFVIWQAAKAETGRNRCLQILGPVVQSVVSLTSSFRVISLTVLADSIYNILIFFAEKMWVAFALQKLLTFFQQKIAAYLRITRCKF